MIGHIPLALLMKQFPVVSICHTLLTFGVGIAVAVLGRRQQVARVVAYIAGAEVLWRATDGAVVWEFGKIAVCAILLVSIVRSGKMKIPLLPLAYFLLLLPGTFIALQAEPLSKFISDVSSLLLGPFALVMCAWFFQQIVLDGNDVIEIARAAIGPVVGTAAIVIGVLAGVEHLRFGNWSNIDSSAGFGPVQVSCALALGFLLAMLCVFHPNSREYPRALYICLGAAFAFVSTITFSRTGIYLIVGSMVVLGSGLSVVRGQRFRFLLVGTALFVVATLYAVPWLNRFTRGAFSRRFSDTRVSRRDLLALSDLNTFRRHLVFGVGLAGSNVFHIKTRGGYRAEAHTEPTRMLAEHGLFGLVALLLLVASSVQNLRRHRDAADRALIAAVLSWVLLYSVSSAMRTVAPAFLFGWTFAPLKPNLRLARGRSRRRRAWLLPAWEPAAGASEPPADWGSAQPESMPSATAS
jgi:hypothetical protein